jgi:peptide deformylase
MSANHIIESIDLQELRVLRYPDPRLTKVCAPLEELNGPVGPLVERMFELMFAHRGVGLAGPQVGIGLRLFVASPAFEETDRRIYINPEIISLEGQQDGDEGCLSFPDIHCRIKRAQTVTVRAQSLDGTWFKETCADLAARIVQHESDHLDGRLLIDRMGTVAKLANRRALKELKEKFALSH